MAFLLSLSIAALAAGPLLFRLASSSRSAAAMLDGFVRFAVAGLLLVHVMPWAWNIGGWLAGVFFVGGLVLPMLLHRVLSGRKWSGVGAELGIGAFALGLHAFLDGAAIFEHEEAGSTTRMLAAAVILHRLPVGIGVWWLVRPRFGRRTAVAVLILLAIATVSGSFFSQGLIDGASANFVAVLQALFAGALLHVVLGHHFSIFPNGNSDQENSADAAKVIKRSSALGGLLGLGLLATLSSLEPASSGHLQISGFIDALLALTVKSAPALLAASATIMLTKALVPGTMLRFFHGKTAWGQALRGTVAGLPVPICSCGVVPIYRGLIGAGTPPTAALAFLVAAPEVGWAAIMLSFGLLGSELTIARLLSAALLAMVIGLWVGRMVKPQPVAEVEIETKPPIAVRLRDGFKYGFVAIVDDTAPWIIAGLMVAAAVEPAIGSEWLAGLPPGTDVIAATLIGLPLYVCASGSTPLVAVLIAKGLSPGAAIAFLLTGPATNLTTAGLLSSLHGRKVAVVFAITMIAMAIFTGFGVNALMPTSLELPVTSAMHQHPGGLELLAAGALVVMYLASLFRLGATGFIAKVINPHAEEKPVTSCCSTEQPTSPNGSDEHS